MSTLSKLAHDVKDLSAQMVEARSIDTRAKDLNKAGDELKEQVEHLRPLVDSFALMRSIPEIRDRIVSMGPPTSLVEELTKADRDATKAGVTMIESGAINLTSLRSKLYNWRTNLHAGLASAWQAFVNARFEPMDTGLLDALERCGYQAEVKALRESGNDIAQARQQLPRSHREIEKYTRAIAAYQKLLADLEAPAAVKKFLVETVGSGASLAALTEEVRTWLASRQLQSNFLVKVRQSGFRL